MPEYINLISNMPAITITIPVRAANIIEDAVSEGWHDIRASLYDALCEVAAALAVTRDDEEDAMLEREAMTDEEEYDACTFPHQQAI